MSTTTLLNVFQAADQLFERLFNDGLEATHLKIRQLHAVIEETYAVKVTLKLVDVETRHVYGFIERYGDGTATVYIVKTISDRWKRLVATKELCHLALEQPEEQSTDGIDTLQRLFSAMQTVDLDAPENAQLWSEYLAEILAWELLYPHEFRRKDAAAIIENKFTQADIAARYQIPEWVAGMLLSKPYLDMCDKYWRQVLVEKQKVTGG